jgi:hypothetical protein
MNTDAVDQRESLRTHLQSLGVLAGPLWLVEPVALLAECPSFELAADGTLTFDGCLLRTTPRHLSDLLTAGGDQPVRLTDRRAAQAAIDEGHDPLLYRAVRDVFPPRPLAADCCVRADLVVYEPGTLPGGEPHRSLGHWNLPAQLEVFQFLTGRMAFVVAGETSGGRRFVYFQVCRPGDTVAVPLGVWHVSYVLDGPAAVFNISANLNGPVSSSNYDDKYRRGAPVEVTLCRRGESVQPVSTPDTRQAWGDPLGPPRTAWLTDRLTAGQSLAGMHLNASTEQWANLATAILEAHEREWPVRGGFLSDTREA